eukprot:TRINITY_DN108830_c0_g1_i1.p1 TRINITY_DN108830_c0_g1~~TRINITY_DN108830_c0_g1_i1.p1  ORF type:complete len:579 (+),score=148.04 TRINITY_DN108830_c0_g1_i1:43-1779(+)
MATWRIIGGATTGGILVREGEGLKSAACADRLSTGATVEELALKGDRLHYKRLTGTGPEEGWISISITGKVLAERAGDDSGGGDDLPAEAKIVARCQKECAKKATSWQPVTLDQFVEKWNKELPGIRYGLNFPHSPELLTSSKYGAPWLTKAFHAAGTMDKSNTVTRIVRTQPLTGGGACLKLLIEVEYQKPSADLHTKLFMKYPYNYDEKTQKSDRMNSSVMLQGMEVSEVDSYRLLESSLPFPMPRYYFGDISNESTNFILITELIAFGDKAKKLEDYKPLEIEPAYDKFLDFEQFKPYDAFEYYKLMTQSNAKMAAWYKIGKLGDPKWLSNFFPDNSKHTPPGLGEAEFKRKLQMGEEFLTTVAKQMFPPELLSASNVQEWKRILNIVNTYKPEMYHAAGHNDDYCAVMHGNMNPDNTWFWRDGDKKLQMGALDFGGLSKVSIAPKIWWSFYAAEFDMLESHLEELLETFVDTYASEGGPRLDAKVLRRDFMLSALDQAVGILGAIPMIYKVVPKKDWPTVADRNDERLRKSFLTRMYVQGFVLIYTMLFKFDLSKMVDEFIASPGMPKKQLATL